MKNKFLLLFILFISISFGQNVKSVWEHSYNNGYNDAIIFSNITKVVSQHMMPVGPISLMDIKFYTVMDLFPGMEYKAHIKIEAHDNLYPKYIKFFLVVCSSIETKDCMEHPYPYSIAFEKITDTENDEIKTLTFIFNAGTSQHQVFLRHLGTLESVIQKDPPYHVILFYQKYGEDSFSNPTTITQLDGTLYLLNEH